MGPPASSKQSMAVTTSALWRPDLVLSRAVHVDGTAKLLVGQAAHARGIANLVFGVAALVEGTPALVIGCARLVGGSAILLASAEVSASVRGHSSQASRRRRAFANPAT